MHGQPQSRVFVSHSSVDAIVAKTVGNALKAAGFDVWLDSTNIRLGVLLRNELHEALQQSRAIALLWSESAFKSRWVAAEILIGFHMNRFIIPCVLDDVPLPEFLRNSVHLDLRKDETEALGQLARAIESAPKQSNALLPWMASASADLKQAIAILTAAQERVTSALSKRDLKAASEEQEALDPYMKQAEQVWQYELMILNLGGYHRKNGYIVKHWDAIQAGRPPKDPLLLEGEKLFFKALFVNPLDRSALNGLGSILFHERELDAAEFFVRRAIALSTQLGESYSAAEHDLKLIKYYKEHKL